MWRAVFVCSNVHWAVGIFITLITLSAVAGIPENTLFMGFIWVAVKTAFVCRQAGCVTDLFTAEYTGTVAITGTGRAKIFGGSPAAAGLEHRHFPKLVRKA